MVTRIIPALLLIAVAAPAAAQNEAALKSYFEGKRITVRLDMPGDADGVDVHADARIALDYGKYKDKLKRYGTAIHSGDTVVVTLVKVKKDLIEFQLGGGGFGTFGDDTSTSANLPLIEKSSRERELEKRIKDEDDRDPRHRLGAELDDLRDHRERENRRVMAERVRIALGALPGRIAASFRLAGEARPNAAKGASWLPLWSLTSAISGSAPILSRRTHPLRDYVSISLANKTS
jgi:hypothetical protein